MKLSICIIFLFLLSTELFTAEINLEYPKSGFTSQRIQRIKGRITNFKDNKASLVVNGIPQWMLLNDGEFDLNVVVAPGQNMIEVKAEKASEKVSFYANVQPRDIKIILTWDTQTDVDLWVIDPKGEKCNYSSKSTTSGGNLDVDVTSGYGPETFTMAKALPGNYAIQVQYYSANSSPITNVRVYFIIEEGTPRERKKEFQFTMTKSEEVYHIGDFFMGDGE